MGTISNDDVYEETSRDSQYGFVDAASSNIINRQYNSGQSSAQPNTAPFTLLPNGEVQPVALQRRKTFGGVLQEQQEHLHVTQMRPIAVENASELNTTQPPRCLQAPTEPSGHLEPQSAKLRGSKLLKSSTVACDTKAPVQLHTTPPMPSQRELSAEDTTMEGKQFTARPTAGDACKGWWPPTERPSRGCSRNPPQSLFDLLANCHPNFVPQQGFICRQHKYIVDCMRYLLTTQQVCSCIAYLNNGHQYRVPLHRPAEQRKSADTSEEIQCRPDIVNMQAVYTPRLVPTNLPSYRTLVQTYGLEYYHLNHTVIDSPRVASINAAITPVLHMEWVRQICMNDNFDIGTACRRQAWLSWIKRQLLRALWAFCWLFNLVRRAAGYLFLVYALWVVGVAVGPESKNASQGTSIADRLKESCRPFLSKLNPILSGYYDSDTSLVTTATADLTDVQK